MEENTTASILDNTEIIDTPQSDDVSEPLQSKEAEFDYFLEAQPMDEKTYEDIHEEKESLVKKVKASFWWTIIRTLIALIIIAVGVYLVLYLVARAAKYETISAMLQSMYIELQLMWQRVLY